MKKLALKLDELCVESFDTSLPRPERGTVRAREESPAYTCGVSCLGTCALTCWGTCPNSCQGTCYITCNASECIGSCAATCGNTCTCDPYAC
jgi:hypothetical protein